MISILETGTSSNPDNELEIASLTALDLPQLFQQHRQHLLRFVQRYVRNVADAEDIVQNTFVEAMRCAHKFSGLSKPSTWLYGIAQNLARNLVRQHCNSLVDYMDDSLLTQRIDETADPHKREELRQTAMRVSQLLESLHPEIRATFEFVVEEELTYEEASAELSIPIGTVRSRVSRVRSSVRTMLN